MSPTSSSKFLDWTSDGHVTTSSRPPSKFFSRVSVGHVSYGFYYLLTDPGQTLNPIKSAGASSFTDNEAAMRDFQAAVSNVPTSSRPCFG